MTERLISCNEPCPMISVKDFFVKKIKSDKTSLEVSKKISSKNDVTTN